MTRSPGILNIYLFIPKSFQETLRSGSRVKLDLHLKPVLPLVSCLYLGKWLYLSEPQVLYV